ncbi:MAG: type II toxin-antitoxin system PemK/MazF family toxin [Oscillospiraceae bacterium]|nr:type II toxin-antitoxin system PemK/MazF family toxin [Oscillospiraceae bacterium]
MARAIKRGEIYYAALSGGQGFEQDGMRPVVIIQNDVGNRYSPTTLIAPITSSLTKRKLPTHVLISSCESGLPRASNVLCEQIRVIDKNRLMNYVSDLDGRKMTEVNEAISISFGIDSQYGALAS